MVAIEPAPGRALCLRRNFEAEVNSGRVIVYPKGVWDRAGTTPDNLPLTTIDSLVAELKLERVDFIKMDIKGAEQRALRGASATIRRFRPRMALAVYHLPEDRTAIPQIVRSVRKDYDVRPFCVAWYGQVRQEIAYFK